MPDFYGTAAAFTAYHSARDNTVPADVDTDAEIEVALLVASEWIDARYRSQFQGWKTAEREQLREWPRRGHVDYYGYLIPDDEVPREIQNAVYEIALRHLNSPGVLSIDYTPSVYDSVSVDGAVSAKFAKFGSASEIQTQFKTVAEILSGLLSAKGSSGNLTGSSVRT